MGGMTFESLFETARKEKEQDLQEIPSTFYDDAYFYYKNKKESLDRIKNKDDPFSRAEQEKLEDEIINIKRLLKDIFDRRTKKIIDLAFNSARADGIIEIAMISEEKEFFSKILMQLKEHRQNGLNSIFELKKSQKKRIKITKKIEAFLGPDQKEYGPFEPELSTSLPEEIASILIKNESATAE